MCSITGPSITVLLILIVCWRQINCNGAINLLHNRIFNLLKTKQRYYYRRTLRSSGSRNTLDIRDHRIFHSDQYDCCPTITDQTTRKIGINNRGVMLELFSDANGYDQVFYETRCHPKIKDHPCRYVDSKLRYASRCEQQYSYVYAIGRRYRSNDQYALENIRVATGCKCRIVPRYLSRRKKK